MKENYQFQFLKILTQNILKFEQDDLAVEKEEIILI